MAGPIDRCPDGGAHWRQRLTPILEDMGLIVFDPLNKPIECGLETDDYRALRAVWKRDNDFDELSRVMKTVRNVDLRMVDITDFTITYLDMSMSPCGTMEEVFTANREKKPVVLWCPQGKWGIPDWMFGAFPHRMFFETEEDVIGYLKHVDEDPVVETHKRWMFFDAKKLYPRRLIERLNAA